MTDGLSHLNSRERAVRLAHRQAKGAQGGGVDIADTLPPPLGSDVGVDIADTSPAPAPDETAITAEVEIVKATIADVARRHPGGLAYGWDGDRLLIRLPLSAEAVTVEEAVRRRLIGSRRLG